MKLIPQSLFWRLALVLFVGLVTSQILSMSLHLGERERLMIISGGMQPAQRIVDTVQILDATPRAERDRLIKILDTPSYPVVLGDAPSSSLLNAGPPTHEHGRAFLDFLRKELGGQREIILAQAEGDASLFQPEAMAMRHAAMHPGGRPLGGPGVGPAGMGGMADMAGPADMPGQLFLNTYIRLADNQWLHFGTALSPPTADLPQRLTLTLISLVGAVLLITLLAVRWVTRPLNRLAVAADELGRDLHRPPIAEDGPTEARLAAAAFNRMQAQLVRVIDDRTRMLAAMSHDLKTPITRMRLRADLLDDDDLRGRFETDLKEMEAMVRDTLDFMRGLDPSEQRQSVDLNALLGSLAADATEMGRQAVVNGVAAESLPGVPRLLKRCLGNLIDNAVVHGGSAEILVEDTPKAVTVIIADRGPGIPEAELEKVFDPFYRRDASRSRETGGTGLGLSIARAVAEFHGGSLRLHKREGGGLEAVLSLPR